MTVTLRLPGSLAELAGGTRALPVQVDVGPATVADVLDAAAAAHPALGRRVRDETGAVRRFVNLYVGDTDIRHAEGLATHVHDGDVVHVLPSVAGG
jgi:molybdopterin converting factor small subunit